MNLKMFSIRDTKGEAFFNPFYSPTHGEAERQFQAVTNDPKSTINQFPEDFDLYEVGVFNTSTGKIEALDSPRHLIKAIQVKKV